MTTRTWPQANGLPKSLGDMNLEELRQARLYSRKWVHAHIIDKDAAKLREFLIQQQVHALDILIAISEGREDASKYE